MRSPQHLIDAMPRPHGKQAVWEAVLAATGSFNGMDIWREVNHNQKGGETDERTVKGYLKRLVKAGILSCKSSQNVCEYTLVKKLGVVAPVVKADGTMVEQRGNGNQRMWRVIKVLGSFNYREVAMAAETAPETAKTYLMWLCRAEYLVVTQKSSNAGKPIKYRLNPNRYTGPHPPQIQRIKTVYDPNLQEVVYPKAEENLANV